MHVPTSATSQKVGWREGLTEGGISLESAPLETVESSTRHGLLGRSHDDMLPPIGLGHIAVGRSGMRPGGLFLHDGREGGMVEGHCIPVWAPIAAGEHGIAHRGHQADETPALPPVLWHLTEGVDGRWEEADGARQYRTREQNIAGLDGASEERREACLSMYLAGGFVDTAFYFAKICVTLRG